MPGNYRMFAVSGCFAARLAMSLLFTLPEEVMPLIAAAPEHLSCLVHGATLSTRDSQPHLTLASYTRKPFSSSFKSGWERPHLPGSAQHASLKPECLRGGAPNDQTDGEGFKQLKIEPEGFDPAALETGMSPEAMSEPLRAEEPEEEAVRWNPTIEEEDELEDDPVPTERTRTLHALAASLVLVLLTGFGTLAALWLAIELQKTKPWMKFVWNRFAHEHPYLKDYVPFLTIPVGYGISQWLSLAAQKRFGAVRIDRTTSIFLQGLIRYSTFVISVFFGLKLMGLHTYGLDTLLASVGIAVGFASQKVLQNLAAGIILLLFRPFKVGDKIHVGDISGWVTHVMLFETRLRTDDRRQICIANGEIYEHVIENLTGNKMRRVQINFCTAGSADVIQTRKAIEEAIASFEPLWRGGQPGEATVQLPPPQPKKARKPHSGVDGPRRSPSWFFKGLKKTLDTNGDGKVSLQDLVKVASYLVVTKQASIASQSSKPDPMPSPRPPLVVMPSISNHGYHWLVFIWAPSLEHDKWYVTATEAIAINLQKHKIKVVAEVLDSKASIAVPMK